MSHIGRSFDGRPLEDACPCPQEPCGLIDVSRIDPACGQHALAAGKTIRQSHTAERCAMTAPTSPKPHTPADPNDLRTALTKLADDLDSYMYVPAVRAVRDDLRALLAAHPAPAPVSDTRREDVARALRMTQATHPDDQARLARWWDEGLTSPEDRAVVLRQADALLAVLPAPPVVRDPQHVFRCQCGHGVVEHEQGSGCLAGWTWDEEGIAVQDGCHCQWAHIMSPTAEARLRGATRG